jgi:hypothetical protein
LTLPLKAHLPKGVKAASIRRFSALLYFALPLLATPDCNKLNRSIVKVEGAKDQVRTSSTIKAAYREAHFGTDSDKHRRRCDTATSGSNRPALRMDPALGGRLDT